MIVAALLLTAAQSGMPIVEEWIETVYLNDNASSHFNPLRDSLKIYMCILKFSASSLLAFVVDYVLALILRAVTGPIWSEPVSRNFSIIVARIVSGTVNFTVNRRMVFKGNERLGRAILKYVALAAVILALNLGLMQLFTTLGLSFALAKIITEALLFCLSFVVQGKFVFRRRRR